MTWWDYVERVADTARQRDITDVTGVDATEVTRWKKGKIPSPRDAAKFARGYKKPVLEAFVQAEFLTAFEAKQRPSAPPDPSDLASADLLDELGRRLLYAEELAARDVGQPPGQSGPAE